MTQLQQAICTAFCDGFKVRELPAGYVITSPFTWLEDEPLVFYADKNGNQIRFEDSGDSLSMLEDIAGDLTSDARLETIRGLAQRHSITFDEEQYAFSSQWMNEQNAGRGVIDFLSFMNRLQDLQFLSREKVENTFREDLVEALRQHFDGPYQVSERTELDTGYSGYITDILITSESGSKAAIYAATAEVKVLEALLASELVMRENINTVRPFLVFEDFIGSSISKKNRNRSMNNEVLRIADWSNPDEAMSKIESSLKHAA